MNEQRFRSEMRRAEAMRTTADDLNRVHYWDGYKHGLRRGHHGEKFGHPGEHETWLALVDSTDESRQHRGRGYRDGLAYCEIASQTGRPPVAGNTVHVSVTLPASLVERIPKPWARSIREVVTRKWGE